MPSLNYLRTKAYILLCNYHITKYRSTFINLAQRPDLIQLFTANNLSNETSAFRNYRSERTAGQTKLL